MSDETDLSPLPRPTVKYITDLEDITEATARGMISNPIYVGVPPYRRIVSDEAWIRAAAELIREEGPEQFLVNMLHMLRLSIVEAVPDEAIPDDYDGPWPDDDEDEDYQPLEDDDLLDFAEELSSPWLSPMEGLIFCSHDDLPMIVIDDEFVCVAEYVNAHIDNSPVTDLVTEPTLALVFQNGHTFPLLCPGCGESLHVTDHNTLLDDINGLTIINIDWDADIEELIIEFGKPGDDLSETEELPFLAIHLNSVRELTCPHKNLWYEAED